VSTLLRKPWNIALRAGVPTWPQLVCRAQLHHLECFGRTRRVATRCNAPGAHRARPIAMHVATPATSGPPTCWGTTSDYPQHMADRPTLLGI
jgi:hypothetical protein